MELRKYTAWSKESILHGVKKVYCME